MRFEYIKEAIRDLEDLDQKIRERIIKKLDWFLASEKPLYFAEPIINLAPATHRFRVGDYRVLFEYDKKNDVIVILAIKHRSKVYES